MTDSGKNDPGTAREKMLAVAAGLFWMKGFNDTSVRDIAEAYGCKPANLYNFFPGKEAILHEVLVREMKDLVEPMLPLAADEGGDPSAQLRAFIRQHLSVTLKAGRSTRILFDVALEHLNPGHRLSIVAWRDAYDRVLRTILERGKARGVFADVDVKLAGFMIASMITRCRLWHRPEGAAGVEDLAEFIFRFILNGISAPAGG